jgi:hypothetical protein
MFRIPVTMLKPDDLAQLEGEEIEDLGGGKRCIQSNVTTLSADRY